MSCRPNGFAKRGRKKRITLCEERKRENRICIFDEVFCACAGFTGTAEKKGSVHIIHLGTLGEGGDTLPLSESFPFSSSLFFTSFYFLYSPTGDQLILPLQWQGYRMIPSLSFRGSSNLIFVAFPFFLQGEEIFLLLGPLGTLLVRCQETLGPS